MAVAIVTGGARGLGAAISTVLLEKGYKVCIADIQVERGTQFVSEQQKVYGAQNIIFAVCDVTKEEDFKRVFDQTVKEFGRIDLLVNNAGTVNELNPRICVDVNLMGPIIGCKMALKYMGKSNGGQGGMVINTASIAGFLSEKSVPVYSATKHGVIGLTRGYGDPYHLSKEGVIFAALCPSYIKTEMLANAPPMTLIPDADHETEAADLLMSPEYVAGGFAKLLEDKINGSTLVVNIKRGYHYAPLPDLSY